MSSMATRDGYGKALVDLGKENEDIIVLDADLSGSTKTSMFNKEYPDRFINVGVAEQNLIGMAAGIATVGKIPYASSFAMFATGRAFEILRNSVGYPNLNVKVCATHAGITVGEDGASHQALEDIACVRAIPNFTVIVPSDAIEAEMVVKEISKIQGPFYVRLGRAKIPVINDNKDYKLEIGKGVTLKEGNDITIIATGIMVNEALEARKILSEKGINARIINMHTIKPIDKDIIIKAAEETKGIITAEEHNIIGGLGSAVAEVLSENHPTLLKRIGVRDVFGESGNPDDLMKKYGLKSSDIVKSAVELLSK